MGENRNGPLVVELSASAEDVTPETAPPVPGRGSQCGAELYWLFRRRL